MCEIVYLHFLDEKKGEGKREIIKKIAKDIYSRNSDGIGILLDRKKIVKEVNIKKWIEKIDGLNLENVNEVIIHSRLATSGNIDNKNTQPIKKGEIVVIHNGVFTYIDGEEKFEMQHTVCKYKKTNTDNNEKSDTAVFTDRIETYYKEKKDLKDAIKEVLKRTSGSASIFITNGDELYYYKHNKPFAFRYVKDLGLIVGATKINKILDLLKKKKKILGFEFKEEFKEVGKKEIEEDTLYEINNLIQKVGKVKMGEKIKKKDHERFWYKEYYIK